MECEGYLQVSKEWMRAAAQHHRRGEADGRRGAAAMQHYSVGAEELAVLVSGYGGTRARTPFHRCAAPRVPEPAGAAPHGAVFPSAGEGERAERPPRLARHPAQLAAIVVSVLMRVIVREMGRDGRGRDKEKDKMLVDI
uniref:Uncharacterized protein n=1 Tax=Oryza glumipatula TaxID=40148 RepID=A0A0E0BHJ2_9ORYZ